MAFRNQAFLVVASLAVAFRKDKAVAASVGRSQAFGERQAGKPAVASAAVESALALLPAGAFLERLVLAAQRQPTLLLVEPPQLRLPDHSTQRQSARQRPELSLLLDRLKLEAR